MSERPFGVRLPMAVLCLLLLTGCGGPQSTFGAAGREASAIEGLLVVTVIGATLIWMVVVSFLVYAGDTRRRLRFSEERAQQLITWGGVVTPTAVLFVLLSYAVWSMPATRPWFDQQPPDLEIEVTGEQFWWRIRYLDKSGHVAFETANEMKLPVDRRIRVSLKAHDVIHSFWIPALAGKMDTIPGRTNSLWLEPTRVGTYRGPCAEFCGTSHAFMNLTAIVLSEDDFQTWHQNRVKRGSAGNDATRAFLLHGCAACHAIDGTNAKGLLGPNLTGFADRGRIGAGALTNTPENLARFIRDPAAAKPGVQMPAFPMIPTVEMDEIVEYLAGET
ncbi:cytochrome c oxidase subunit II [Ensifer canadensis]